MTSIATEAPVEVWSPDGKNILFTSDVYPECDGAPAEETACNAKKLKEAEQSKVKAQIFTHLLYRHWNAYKEGKRSHIFVVEVAGAPTVRRDAAGKEYDNLGFASPPALLRDLTPGDYDAPVFSLGGQDDYAFSPDGQEICYTSNHDKNPAASTNNDLWIVPINQGGLVSGNRVTMLPPQPKNITADNPASDSTPLYSPDGRYIAYRAQQRPGYESDRFRLMLYDRKTGEKKNLTEDFDHWVGSFAWAPDSIYAVLLCRATRRKPDFQAWRFRNPNRSLLSGDSTTMCQWAPDGKRIFFSQMSLRAPSEILGAELVDEVHLVPAESKGECNSIPGGKRACAVSHRLTYLNDVVRSEITMSAYNPFWFTGANGDKVEGFIVKPPEFDASKKYPVKFLIHGGPQGAWGDDWSYRWNPELFAANGYVVIMINFHGSTGYGQKFIDAINGDWGGAPYEDLMKGLDYAEEHYAFIDKSRECALGASYGGYMINWILGHTDRFKCLVSHDGMFNAESAWGSTEELWFNDWEFKGTPYDNRASYQKWSPHQYAKNFKTPTLVVHGQRDYRLDVSEGFQLFTTLQMEGVPSKMLYFPDEGHWVLKPQNSRLWYQTVNDWVDQWTKK